MAALARQPGGGDHSHGGDPCWCRRRPSDWDLRASKDVTADQDRLRAPHAGRYRPTRPALRTGGTSRTRRVVPGTESSTGTSVRTTALTASNQPASSVSQIRRRQWAPSTKSLSGSDWTLRSGSVDRAEDRLRTPTHRAERPHLKGPVAARTDAHREGGRGRRRDAPLTNTATVTGRPRSKRRTTPTRTP